MKYEAGRTLREQDTDASDVDALTLASPGMSIKHHFIMFTVTALHLISISIFCHLSFTLSGDCDIHGNRNCNAICRGARCEGLHNSGIRNAMQGCRNLSRAGLMTFGRSA